MTVQKFFVALFIILALSVSLGFAMDGFYKTTNIIETNGQVVKLTASNYSKILGNWVSLDDERYTIQFSKGHKIDFYDDGEVAKDKFALYREYPKTEDSLKNKRGKYLFVGDGEDQLVYELKMLDEDVLEMIYLDRGNLLRFKKIN